jgi:hypothetical protein
MQVRAFPEVTFTADFAPPVVEAPPGLLVEGYDMVKAQVVPPVSYVNDLPTVGTPTVVAKAADRDRIIVNGVDVTFFRSVHTPTPGFLLTEPFGYGSTTITFPQVSPALEAATFGTGALSWVRLDAPVKIERVNAAGTVVGRDYRGFVTAIDTNGADLTLEVAGEWAGRAAMQDRQVPLFKRTSDVGRFAYELAIGLRLPFTPRLGPTTGIKIATQGGMTQLDWGNRICSMSSKLDGSQRVIMPVSDTNPRYQFRPKDMTTVHATVYFDDARVVPSLRRDKTEENNVYYASGITPGGMKVKNGAYPGLKQGVTPPYPISGGTPFGVGTTNDDLDNPADDDLGAMLSRLEGMGYLSRVDLAGGYDDDAADAIKELQRDAGLTASGTMNPATWDALYDLSVTGYSLSQSVILPMVQDPRTRMWLRTASGAKLGRDPLFDRTVIESHRTLQFGTGQTRQQMRNWTRAEYQRGQTINWVGTIAHNGFGLIAGEHNPGDPDPTADDLISIREARPGWNVWSPQYQCLLHVSGIQIAEGGRDGTMTVDTRNRDHLAVTEILARNQDAKSDPTRAFLAQHRKSSQAQDSMTTFDEVGGVLFDRVNLDADDWTVFPVVAGQEGEIAKLRLELDGDPCEFVTAVFALEPTRAWLNDVISNPFARAGDGEIKWTRDSVRTRLDKKVLLYVAGTAEQPCGYFPGQKYSEDEDGNRVLSGDGVTGVWKDEANFHYHTVGAPVLWVAVYPKQACHIAKGRIMWPQLEEGQ